MGRVLKRRTLRGAPASMGETRWRPTAGEGERMPGQARGDEGVASRAECR